MGQHKHNPTAIKAKNGELPPKPKTLGKREVEKIISEACKEVVYKPFIDMYTKIQTEERDCEVI